MNLDEFTIAQAREAARLLNPPASEEAAGPDTPESHGLQIVILDRGWVYVGRVTTTRDWMIIEDAQCVRYWGTTRGLGEIAAGGPTASTKLDPCPTVKASRRALIALVRCEESKWTNSR